MEEVKIYLRRLGFSSNESKVYLALANLGEAPTSQIAKKAGLPRTTTASILDKMAEEAYISPHRYQGKTYYWIESPEIFSDKLEHQLATANKLQDSLVSLYHGDGKFPVGKTFDTKKSIYSFMEKSLLATPKNSVIYTIDDASAGNYSKILTATEYFSLLTIKKRRHLLTKTLVPHGDKIMIDQAKLKAQDIEIKELPAGINFQGSFWVLNKQLISFGGTPPFLTVQKHKQIVEGFFSLWQYFFNNNSV